jgi:hypothetical protein
MIRVKPRIIAANSPGSPAEQMTLLKNDVYPQSKQGTYPEDQPNRQ